MDSKLNPYLPPPECDPEETPADVTSRSGATEKLVLIAYTAFVLAFVALLAGAGAGINKSGRRDRGTDHGGLHGRLGRGKPHRRSIQTTATMWDSSRPFFCRNLS